MRKEEFMNKWRKITPNQKIKITPIEYKHTGSTFDCDGIRILGSMKFIESVLSNIKEILDYESGETRLQVSLQESKVKGTDIKTGSYSCYIQVCYRGDDSRTLNDYIKAAKDSIDPNFKRINNDNHVI